MLLLPGPRLGPRLLPLEIKKLFCCSRGIRSEREVNTTAKMGTSATTRLFSLLQRGGSDDMLGDTVAVGTRDVLKTILAVLLALPDFQDQDDR